MKIAVVGGGISGLSCCYYLLKKGHEVYLFEKEEKFGGTIRTEKIDGFLIEGGPDCFLREKEWGERLIKEIGMEDELEGTDEKARRVFVLWKGELHEIPEGFFLMVPTRFFPLLKSGLFSPAGKLRAVLEVFIPPQKEEKEESLASFVMRRFGREVLERVAEPLLAGVHAGDPEKMSIQAVFPRFVEMERKYGSLIRGMMIRMGAASSSPFLTLKNGLGSLVDKLLELIKEKARVLPARPVERTKRKNGKWEVMFKGGNELFDSVVIATPSFHAAEFLKEYGEVSQLLFEIPYVSTATVSMAYREGDIEIPDGHGFVIPALELRRIMAVTFSSKKFRGRAPSGFHLIRVFLGGYRNQEIVGLPDEKMKKLCLEEIASLLKVKREPVFTKIYRWLRAMPQYHLGHAALVKEIEKRLPEGIYLTGNAYYGIGIPDCIRRGWEIAEIL